MRRSSTRCGISPSEGDVDWTMNSDAFLEGLCGSLGYVRGYVASQVVFEVLKDGLLPLVEQGLSLGAIAERKGYKPELLEALFEYLVVEDVLEKRRDAGGGAAYGLSPRGRDLEKYRGWFYMLVGGYGPIFSNLGKMRREGT